MRIKAVIHTIVGSIPPFGRTAILPALLLLLTCTAFAQNDRQYNTIQHGLRGMILGGAMVAGVHDNSAIYYNPSALGSSGSEGLDISLFGVSMEFNKRKNALNTGSDIKQTKLAVTPGLITFNARPFKNKRLSIAGASITRNNFDNISDEVVVTELPEGIRVNSLEYENIGREFWLAGAVAYNFEKNVAIGISQYLTITSNRYEHVLAYKLFDKDVQGQLLFEESERLQFRQKQTIGLISRLGFSWYSDHVKIGATFTTPLYGPFLQSTNVIYERTRFEEGEATSRILKIDERGKLKMPFSASLGVEYSGKGYLFAASVEYYHGVNDYRRLSADAGDIYTPLNGEEPFEIWDGRKKVFNLNLGWEITLNKKVDYLGGLRTNFNFNNQPSDYTAPRVHYSYFDIYHLTTGLKMTIKHSSFTVGIDYGFSFNDNLPPVANLNTSDIQPLDDPTSSIAYNNFTFLFTYNFLLDRFSDIFKNGED